jgi:hypothetical protein
LVIPPMECRPPPKKKQMGSASTWARFLMGLGKQRRERRSRHLGVVGLAVGCAPGWGIVFIPSMERRADTMGSASAWPVSPWVLAADAANGWALQSCSSTSPTLPRRPAPHRRNRPRPHPRLGRSRWTPRRGIHSWGAPWGFLPSRPGRLAGHSSGPWRAPSSERLPCSWPAWRLAPPRRRRRVSPPLTALLAQALSCSRSCHSCADAVAELLLQPSPPSRSPCRHVAVA